MMNKSLTDVARALYGVSKSISCKVCIICKEDDGNEHLSCVDCIEIGLRTLIEKETPKKLTGRHYEENGKKPYIKYTCPNGCKIQLRPIGINNLAHESRYCPKCGQKIYSEYIDDELEASDEEWERWNR